MTRRLSHEERARREFKALLRRDGFPSWAPYCVHGVPGGLWCVYCQSDPSRLPESEQFRGAKGSKPRQGLQGKEK